MNYKNLLFLLFIFSSFSAFSLTLRDSIGVENLNGKKVIIHKIESKETYYSLGRKYKISPQVIMAYNKSQALQPGEIIKIPTQQNFTSPPTSFSSTPEKTKAPKTKIHKVKAGETLYAIADQYNMRVDDLKLLNNLNSNSIGVGEQLKVIESDEVSINSTLTKNKDNQTVEKPNPTDTEPKNILNQKIKYIDSTDSQSQVEIPKNRYGITEVNEKGVAVWIDDNNLDATKSFALHRSAPVGTIMKITNPMTGRSVFAKVVGRFTENETTKDVIVVVTKATADAIGTLDKRFLVNITFGIPNEQ
ncbi:MAG: LysM peptidoglycan-binding domain-containing protein [Bacteroidetes bacterium]|nr:LysM peptidoglycan-binding domain-containing protein [Bacteroidota bacterium]MBU1372175.1 LysM peptidoglycan-binding domain-containing protein [Bacteroidota bacterium]MBU1483347.1 LysM peptidoglycan-binding domain-containing protein [Bacteroidota bacterium]MBU1761165.1 LysM peptidoglycan-binding domain-containing protein [Bacteroidota bacterium]MBU2267027.1 LysM peptidoglycan-binding domain-containing protein [Bacteroidota bacterium]